MKQIYVYQTGEFFQVDTDHLSLEAVDAIIHYGLEKFLNQKANAMVRHSRNRSKEERSLLPKEFCEERSLSREQICERVEDLIHLIEQEGIVIPHTKTLEEDVTAKILLMTDKEKEVYRKLLTE